MNRLTQKDDQGNWSLKGVPWMQLYVGVPMTREVNEKLYGALWKLMEYEGIGLDPEEVERMKEELQQIKFPSVPSEKKMTLDEAIMHAEEVAGEKYAEGMMCHANPDDEELDGCIKCGKEHEQLAEWLTELQQYRQIGTIEECKAARDKQIAKVPAYEGDGYDPDGNIILDEWLCPNCGTRYEVDYDDYDYCPNCGQAIKITESEE